MPHLLLEDSRLLKPMKKLPIIIFPVLLVLIVAYYFNFFKMKIYLSDYEENPAGYLTIWALSDLHLDDGRMADFENAVQDMSAVMNKIDLAIVAGDIVDYENSERCLGKYTALKNRSKIRNWFEIAGNHDHYDIEAFRRYINRPAFYSETFGNLLILFLSNERRGDDTYISDDAFRWWKNKVIHNQDKIIMTITHGFINESGLSGSDVVPQVTDSKRFTDVLRKYRVDLWLNGHVHMNHGYACGRIKTQEDLNSTSFINVASISQAKYIKSHSCILIFKNGSDQVLVRSRSHRDKRFLDHIITFKDLKKGFSI